MIGIIRPASITGSMTIIIAEDSNGSISVSSSGQVTLPVVFLNLERAKLHLLEIYESNLKDHPPVDCQPPLF
jgi:hypothetical protein